MSTRCCTQRVNNEILQDDEIKHLRADAINLRKAKFMLSRQLEFLKLLQKGITYLLYISPVLRSLKISDRNFKNRPNSS